MQHETGIAKRFSTYCHQIRASFRPAVLPCVSRPYKLIFLCQGKQKILLIISMLQIHYILDRSIKVENTKILFIFLVLVVRKAANCGAGL